MGIKKIIFLIIILLPALSWADVSAVPETETEITEDANYSIQDTHLKDVYSKLTTLQWGESTKAERKRIYEKLGDLISSIDNANQTVQSQKKQAYEDAKKKYEDAKSNEQSTANKTLTALTTAATGIGGMELAMGLSEQQADKDAENQMTAYIETMRCTYGGKQVKAGPEEIELPGGNNPEIMKLRTEYISLATSLKERKEALGMKAGIEAEEILDKATMGLYDDENVGITGGAYESLYRAKMLGSEEDQAKIDEDKKASKNRVIAGAVLFGAGVIGGIIGNLAINGKGKKDKPTKVLDVIIDRETFTQELDNYIQSEIDLCNETIRENKQYAEKLKTQSNASDPVVAEYIRTVEGLTELEDINDLEKLKDHPLCR